jgi:hypothetical protein
MLVVDFMYMRDRVPLIEPDGILDKQQSFLRQERRAQCGSEVELVQGHSDHLRVMCNIHRCVISVYIYPNTAVPKPAASWHGEQKRLVLTWFSSCQGKR